MAAAETNSLIVLLLCIGFALGDQLHQSNFTKEIRLQKTTEPFKVNDKLIFNDGYTLTTVKPGAEVLYTLSTVDVAVWPKSILNFGNGKLLFTSRYPGDFFILNEHDFSNYTSNAIPYDEEVNANTVITSVVVYNNTFDVFDQHQEICMPCRYNDKGERLSVEHKLKKESNGTYDQDRYSLELVKDSFGVKIGYFYVYRYANNTTALRILDSKFEVVKQRLINRKVEAHSLTHENLTVCYKRNGCEDYICEYVECQLLNAELDTMFEVKLHQREKQGTVEMKVQNLAGGGAVVAMLFGHENLSSTSVFVQRIRSDGQVDEPIRYDGKDENLVHMDDFTFDNGEYCLVTVNDREAKDPFTLVKCLKP